MEKLTLPAVFEFNFVHNPTQPLFRDLHGQDVTYAIFYNRVELLSELLRKQGVKKGDRVAILGENVVNWAIAYFALAKIGAVCIPLITNLPDDFLELILKRSQAVAVFVSQAQRERLAQVAGRHLRLMIFLEDFKTEKLKPAREKMGERLERELDKIKRSTLEFVKTDEADEELELEETDLAQIFFAPDAANQFQEFRFTQKNLVSAAQAAVKVLNLTNEDRVLLFLPFSYTLACVLGVIAPLLSGAQIIALPRPQSDEELTQWIDRFAPTRILGDSLLARRVFSPWLETKQSGGLVRRFWNKLTATLNRSLKSQWNRLKEIEWLICCNLEPPGMGLRALFASHALKTRLLFGTFETSGLFLVGNAAQQGEWVRGSLLPGTKAKIVVDQVESAWGELWVQGAQVVNGDEFFNTNLLSQKTTETQWMVAGWKNQCFSPDEENWLALQTIEATVNELPEVKETRAIWREEQLELLVFPDPDFQGTTEPQQIETRIREYLSSFFTDLPIGPIRFSDIPLEKNALGQILRSL